MTEQAESERKDPVKPTLDQVFENRKLICCNAARSYGEYERAHQVVARRVSSGQLPATLT